jgi:hypothetical protein
MITARIVIAAAVMAVVARVLWALLDAGLGRSLAAQVVSVGVGIALASALYARMVLAMRIPEARQIEALVIERLRR